jgi:hypothetical protein
MNSKNEIPPQILTNLSFPTVRKGFRDELRQIASRKVWQTEKWIGWTNTNLAVVNRVITIATVLIPGRRLQQ